MIKTSPSGKKYIENPNVENGQWCKNLGLSPDEARRQGWQPITRLAPPGMFPPTVYGYEAKDAYEQDLSDEFSGQSDADVGHLTPATWRESIGDIRAEPFIIDDVDDFEEGLEKLSRHEIPSFADCRGPVAPAYCPSSHAEMMKNLEANWDRIDRRIAERERNPSPPPFGYEINRLLTPGRSSKADTTARDLAIGQWKEKRQL